jgi:DNA-binding MarR family transcriptional regulator
MPDERFFSVVAAVKAVRSLPDGSPATPSLKHTLLVLATYWPNIWPSQHRLAVDMGVNHGNVNKRLGKLEAAGLIYRLRRGRNVSTVYRLRLGTIRKCAVEALATETRTTNSTAKQSADEEILF